MQSKLKANFFKNIFRAIKLEAINLLRKKSEEESFNIARKPIIIGAWVTFILCGIFLIWSVTAKIDSSATAIGKVVLDAHKRTIQHFEGGIIEEILVKDGDKVIKDQPLIKLSEVSARANQEVIRKQLFSLKATKIRLESERDSTTPNFSILLNGEYKDHVELNKIIKGESELFLTRKKAVDEKVSILNKKIEQLTQQIYALQSQQKSINQRINYATDEQKSLDELYKSAIISKTRYLELKKQMSELQGNKGEYDANIAKVKQTISETELEIANLKTQNLNEVIKELQEIQTKIADLEERDLASSDVLQRTILRAPQDGVVNGLKFHTTGGVIPAGGEVMEIVPQDDELILEVRVNPQDIDVVVVGLTAKVRLSAYKAKSLPMLKGEVINVSADSFLDQPTNTSYFLAKIKIKKEEMARVKNVTLYPGMPAECYIVTGERTFMQYLLDPLSVGLNKTFREE